MRHKRWFISVGFGFASIGVLAWMVYVNANYYAGAFHFQEIAHLCIMPVMLVPLTFVNAGQRALAKRIVRGVAFVLPAAALALFLVFKPAHTVEQAIQKVKHEAGYEHVQLKEQYRLMSFTPKQNRFVGTGYVLDAKGNGKASTLFFNPATGQFYPIER